MILEAAKLAYANKTKESITSQKLGSQDFWRIANSDLNKGKSDISPLFSSPEVLSSASAKLFAQTFSKNHNLDDPGISLSVCPSRTNLKLQNISISPKMVEKFIMNLGLSKAYGLDCVTVVVLKICETELCYILAKLFNKRRGLIFQIVRRFHLCPSFLRMLGKGLLLKTTALLVFLL